MGVTRSCAIVLLVAIFVGCASVRQPASDSVRREADALLDQWRSRDGDQFFMISDRLCLLLLDHPSEVLIQLATRRDDFASWLGRLESASFTDFGDSLINRQILLSQMRRTIADVPGTSETECQRP